MPLLIKAVNYDDWNIQMKALFRSQDNWEVIEDGFKELESNMDLTVTQNTTLKATHMKKASFQLYQGTEESGFEEITCGKTSKEA